MTEWNKCPGCGITISGVADYCPNCGAPTERHGVTRGKQRQAAQELVSRKLRLEDTPYDS